MTGCEIFMKEEFNLSEKEKSYWEKAGYEGEEYYTFEGMCFKKEDVKEFIRRLKEKLMTDDISIYDYQNQPNVQKAVEEQIDRTLKNIHKLAGKKLI